MKNKNKYRFKVYTFLSLILSLVTFSSAQQDLFGDWGILDSGAQAGASLMDTLFWFEINTVPQAAMFLAVFAGFYFLSLKFVMTVFDIIDDRLDMGSGGSYSLSDTDTDASTIEKGMSAAIAFMVTQYMGMLGLLLWVVIPSIFLVIFFISTTDMFKTYRAGNSAVNEVNEQVETQLEEVDEELEGVEEEEKDVQSQQEHDVQHIGEDESPEEAERHIKKQLEEFSTIENQIKTIEEQVEEIESEIKSQEQQTEQEEEQEYDLIQKIESQQTKLAEVLNYIQATVKDNEDLASKVQNAEQIKTDVLVEDFAYKTENLDNVSQMLEDIIEMEKNEYQELNEALEEEKDVLKNIKSQKEEIEQLEKEVKRLFKDIEFLENALENEEKIINQAETLAQKIQDREDYQKLEKDEKVIENLEEKFKSVFNEEKEIKDRIKQLKELEKEERNRHEKIVSELTELHQSFKKTRQMLVQIEEFMSNYAEKTADLSNVKENEAMGGFIEEGIDRAENPEKYGENPEIQKQSQKHRQKVIEILNELRGKKDETNGVISLMKQMEKELENYLNQIKQ